MVTMNNDVLKDYLQISRELYDKIFDKIDHNQRINGMNVNLRFKYLKFNPQGEPKLDLLLNTLLNHITHYCCSAQKQANNSKATKTEQDAIQNELYREVKNLFRKWDKEKVKNEANITSGELGEMILWFLMEAVLEAPQVVAKMDLKTNPNLESFGSDGIHVKIKGDLLNLYFGEAKLYKNISNALISVFDSLENFHSNNERLKKNELRLVTSHYKHLTNDAQDKIYDYITDNIKSDDIVINHSCLVGFDWSAYKDFKNKTKDEMFDDFLKKYKHETIKITNLLQNRFDNFSKKTLAFEFFFLPVRSVQELRDRFNEEL